jgi:Ca-activated chloride channel family protein
MMSVIVAASARAQINGDREGPLVHARVPQGFSAAPANPDAAVMPLVANVELVLVNVAVTDNSGQPVTGLSKHDFVLFEDRTEQVIRTFDVEDAALSLGVIFDTSESMDGKIHHARTAVVEFLKTANRADEFFAISFSTAPQLLADFTSSIGEVQNRLAYAVPRGNTALLDAVHLGITKLRQAANPRKALLIISDGGDNSSRYNSRQLRNLVQEADVQLYAIGIFGSRFKTPEEASGERLLKNLTALTGGRTIVLNNVSELPGVAVQIGLELRSQYVLGYRPSRGSGSREWRSLQVRARNQQPGLYVYAKSGYFTPAK